MVEGPVVIRPIVGIERIKEAYGWSEDFFYIMLGCKLPARKINGTWYLHPTNVDDFLRALLVKGKEIKVDKSTVKKLKNMSHDDI